MSALQIFHGGNSTFIDSFDETKFSYFLQCIVLSLSLHGGDLTPINLIDTKCCCPFVSTSFERSSVRTNRYNVELYNIQLSPEGEVNSGGYIPRREAPLVFTKSVDSNFRAF